ncbi:hypothetical protein MBLNU457_6301t1 [Dothideomycetes sp. NU457]
MSSTTTNATQTIDLLLFDTDPQSIGATVLYANPTATAYRLNCVPGEDECGTFNETVTVGPWAPPAATASTGVYDLSVEVPDEDFSFSIHCVMSGTVPATCTTTNIGGNSDDGATAVYTSPASDDSVLAWQYMPVTIVAGQELLGGAGPSAAQTASSSVATSAGPSVRSMSSAFGSSAMAAAPASGSGSRPAMATATASSASGNALSSSSSRTASASPSGSAAATSTSNAAQTYGTGMGSMALAAVVLSWFTS